MLRGRGSDNASGRRLGRYGVVTHLATGAMTDLYIARQQAVGGFEKRLVIKALQARYARNPGLVRMFLDEARLAAKLNHPSIVHVYDVAEAKGKKFIAMEYIQGGTLSDVIRRGVAVGNFLPLDHALHIVGQIAAGLDYAHRHRDPRGEALRIIHGNVSLSNIMVSNEGQAKLIAFGSALVQAQIPRESPLRPAQARYLSPEQLAGQAIDHRSDIYALGIVLYETTVAQPLWRGATDEIVKRVISEPIRPPRSVRPDYPPALETIVMKALEKQPADRYQSADQLRSDLEDFVTAAGSRSGAHQVALYLRDLFPATGPLSDGGVAPARAAVTEGAEASASAGPRGSAARAFLPGWHRRGPTAARWAMIVAIPALTALTAFAFLGRPSARNGAPATLLSEGTPSLRRQRQPAAQPIEAAFIAPSPPTASPPTLAIETPPPAAPRRVIVSGDTVRAERQRQRPHPRGMAVAVSPPAFPLDASPVTPAVSLRSAGLPDPPAPASPRSAVVDSKTVATVVHAHAGEVQACFDRALMEQPDLHGRLSVRAAVDADGQVLEVSLFGPAMAGGGRLQECVLAAFRRWIFPPPQGAAKGSVTYAFRFE